MSAVSAAHPSDELFGHPKGLYVCFFTEMWERFSFYGMKALLLLYLLKHHGFAETDAYVIVGAYGGMVYAVPLIGGLLADRYLGMRKAVVLGGILLSLGHLGMAVEGHQAETINGVVHRDMKPENIILCKDGVVKILDFGLARHEAAVGPELSSSGASGTISGTLSGTRLYRPPEILRGEPATSASDVFSLGAFLYELTAGHHPFAGETPLDVFEAIECRPVASIGTLRAEVPLEVDRLILRMLDRVPSARPTAKEVCAVLA